MLLLQEQKALLPPLVCRVFAPRSNIRRTCFAGLPQFLEKEALAPNYRDMAVSE